MKHLFTPSFIFISIFLSACGDSNTDKKKKLPTVIPTPQPVSIFSNYVGIWELKGTGNIWTIDDEEFTAYNFNSYGCVKTDNVDLTNIKGVVDHLTLSNSKTQLTFTHNASSPQIFSSISELPENCAETNLMTQTDLETNFEFFWHSMNDYYAFFDARNINWQAIYQEYRPLINASMTSQEFFGLIDDIMSEFGDSHLGLTNNVNLDASGSFFNGFTAEVLRSELVDLENGFPYAYQELLAYNEFVIEELLIDRELNQFMDGDAIRWGKLSETVGYIRIDRVQDLTTEGEQEGSDSFVEQLASISQDIADTDTIMQAALNDINSSEALIIDLRFNSGGYDNVSLKIASYFSDKEQVIGTKYISNNNYQGPVHNLQLTESPIDVFNKPIYVITGRSTGSGGEVLSMALKALPQVTMIGEATNGSVSDVLDHQLPNGWNLSLSHEVYKDTTEQSVESIGVTPDISMPVYATKDIIYLSNTPIDFVMQQLKNTPYSTPNINDINTSFEEEFTATKIPGIAVAVIKDDQVVYQKAYGLANIKNQTPVTMDTPFNVGSISKTILAVGIMQQVEKGNISLDDELTNMNLPFDPNNPINDGNGMTLRHLVTHTSGIRDSDGYYCSYYLHENNASLYALFGGEHCPADVISNPLEFYANEYFNENGQYVMDGIYNPEQAGLPNKAYQYSNVGAGLAGYAIEQKLGIDFVKDMQLNIFAPLSMQNTAWHYQQLPQKNPKATQYMINEKLEAIEVPEYSYPTFYDGDLNISANDLAKFLITITHEGEYQGVRILEANTVTEMLTPQTAVFSNNDVQGVFWYKLGSFVGHDGSDPGTQAIMQYNEITNTGAVILMNGEDGILGANQNYEMLLPLFSKLYRYGLSQ